MRVVHVVCTDAFGGVERHVAVLAAAQAQAGHQVVVVGGRSRAMVPAISHADVRHVPAGGVVSALRGLQRYASGADIVHAHMTAAEIAACLAPGTRRVPVVSTRHFAVRRGVGRLNGVTRLGAPAIARRLAGQIAVSRYVADHIDGTSTVVYAGVRDAPAPDPLGRRRTVLVAERLEAEKRTHVSLRGFAASGLQGEGWRLQVAGSGAQRGRLHQLATRLGITGAVDFLGHRTDIPELMAGAGILLASRPDEAFGLSVLEAMACGLPVVAAGSAGHLETVGRVEAPALFAPDDAQSCADQLRRLAADPDERLRLGRVQREYQRAGFTLSAQERDTTAAYRAMT